jgi:hypothetical protein
VIGCLEKAEVGVHKVDYFWGPELHHLIGEIGHARRGGFGVGGDGSLSFLQGGRGSEKDLEFRSHSFHCCCLGGDGIIDYIKEVGVGGRYGEG